MRRARFLLLPIVVLLAALAAPLASAPADPSPELLPDLVADPPIWPVLDVFDYGDGQDRLLLRFSGFIHNQGAGPVDLRSSGRVDDHMTINAQRIFRADGTHSDDPTGGAEVIYEAGDGHTHFHFKDAARYSIWNQARSAEVAPSMKVGFCLGDSEAMDPHAPATEKYNINDNSFCQKGKPLAASVFMGITEGWRDRYDVGMAYQWVDVSEVQPGSYWLNAEMDPEDHIRESSESNNGNGFSDDPITIPGHLASGIVAGWGPTGAPRTITLAAQTFGSPGPRRFRIESAPAHGSLNRAVGETFTGPQVVYTPNPGYSGPDSFTFTAVDSASAYPWHPAAAAVTIPASVTTPSVAISGAPSSLQTGASTQLDALVQGDVPGVTWAVDGIPGGGPASGTVDASGLYVAPAVVPPAGSITVRAQSASGASDEVTIGIAPAPDPKPSPSPIEGPAAGQQGGGNPHGPAKHGTGKAARPLGKPRLILQGRLAFVNVRAGRRGVLRVTAWKGKRRLGGCRARVPAGRSLTCRIRIPKGIPVGSVHVATSLRVNGKVVASSRHPLAKVARHASHMGHAGHAGHSGHSH